ncbi:MAG: DUF4097 family beta strand repeat-containing protein [Deltaproteobacteria bacterium]
MSAIRFLPLAALWVAPLAAQGASRYTLRGADVALYDLAGAVQLEAGSGDAVVVDVARGGADAARLQVATGDLGGRATLRVISPGDRISYPEMTDGSTEIRVRDDGTFGGDHHGDDDDDSDGGRRIRLSSGPGGLEAWADLRVSVPAGRTLAVHLGAGRLTATNVNGRLRLMAANAPVTVNGSNGELAIQVGAGTVRLSGIEGDLNVETGSGGVELTRARGSKLFVETGSGDVRINAARASRVGLETGSGTVTVELQESPDRLVVETGSGDVAITAPADLSAELVMDTGSGDIDTDFPLSVTRSARDHLQGTIGDGKGKISVETGSGEIRLLRGK